jgi:hypothetical protein
MNEEVIIYGYLIHVVVIWFVVLIGGLLHNYREVDTDFMKLLSIMAFVPVVNALLNCFAIIGSLIYLSDWFCDTLYKNKELP